MASMEGRTQFNLWPRLAGVAGVALAFVLTGVIWLHLIDQHATATRYSDGAAAATPPAVMRETAAYPADATEAPRPIP